MNRFFLFFLVVSSLGLAFGQNGAKPESYGETVGLVKSGNVRKLSKKALVPIGDNIGVALRPVYQSVIVLAEPLSEEKVKQTFDIKDFTMNDDGVVFTSLSLGKILEISKHNSVKAINTHGTSSWKGEPPNDGIVLIRTAALQKISKKTLAQLEVALHDALNQSVGSVIVLSENLTENEVKDRLGIPACTMSDSGVVFADLSLVDMLRLSYYPMVQGINTTSASYANPKLK